MKYTSGIIGSLTITLFVGSLLYFLTLLHQDTDFVPNQHVSTTPTQVLNTDFTVAGWIPDWASASGLESMKNNSTLLTNISPVWYEATPNGSLKKTYPSQKSQILTLANKNSIEVTPSIALFDHEVLTSIFSNQDYLTTHIQQIIDAGSEEGVDGIDIDYESTKLSDKEGYFAMLKGVNEGLKAKGKKTVVTVLPQWGDTIRYTSLVETRQVQDLARIANLADEVRIMAYDYTWQGSTYSGPIAPLDWQEEVIIHSKKYIPTEKIVLGIPLYSYEKYIEKDTESEYYYDALRFEPNWQLNTGKRNDARAYTYSTIQKILSENTILKNESYQGERVLRYSKLNTQSKKYEDRVTVYLDKEGIKQRVELAKKYNLKGVAFWRLGDELDLLQKLKE